MKLKVLRNRSIILKRAFSTCDDSVQKISLVQGWDKWRALVKTVKNFKVPSKFEEFLGKLWNYYLFKKDSAQRSTISNSKAKCICLRVKGDMFNPGA